MLVNCFLNKQNLLVEWSISDPDILGSNLCRSSAKINKYNASEKHLIGKEEGRAQNS